MKQFRLRLIGATGEIRHERCFDSAGGTDLWRVTADAADRYGRTGEFLQVFDSRGDMVIRVGVSTARGMKTGARAAA